MSVVVGLPVVFILIAVCAALATGNNHNRWFLCSNKNKIIKNTVVRKRQSGTGQRRINGGKFLDNSSSAKNLNNRGGRGNDLMNSSNVQQPQNMSCDLQIRYLYRNSL